MARGDRRLRTPDGALNQINTRLKERRQALRLTQDELCARLAFRTGGHWNPNRLDIYKLERATRTVTDLELLALAAALECDATWLFLGDTLRNP